MAQKKKFVRLFVGEDQSIQVVPAGKGPPTEGMIHLDVADVFSLMKYRCGDEMHEEDYARLDALRPGEPWPRRKEARKISDMPSFAWNKNQLGDQLGLKSIELQEVLSLPGCPSRRANGRWPTREIAQFMMTFMQDRLREAQAA